MREDPSCKALSKSQLTERDDGVISEEYCRVCSPIAKMNTES